MGSFTKIFKSHKHKDGGPSTPPGDLPHPLWAQATQPSPRRGFGTRVPSDGTPERDLGRVYEKGEGRESGDVSATLQTPPPRRTQDLSDEVVGATKGMALLWAGEGSLPPRRKLSTPPGSAQGARSDVPPSPTSPLSRPPSRPLGIPSPSSNLLVFHPPPQAEEKTEDNEPFAPRLPRQPFPQQQRPLPAPPIPPRPYYSTALIPTYTLPPSATTTPPRADYSFPSSTPRPPYVQALPPSPQDGRPPPPHNYRQYPSPRGPDPYLQSVSPEWGAFSTNSRDNRPPPPRGPDPYLQSVSNAPLESGNFPSGTTTPVFPGAFPDVEKTPSQDPRNWPPPPPQHPASAVARKSSPTSQQQQQAAFAPASLAFHQQFSQQLPNSPFRPAFASQYSAPPAPHQQHIRPDPLSTFISSSYRDPRPIPSSPSPPRTQPHSTSSPQPRPPSISSHPSPSFLQPNPSSTKPKPSPVRLKPKATIIHLCSSDSDAAHDLAPSPSTSRSTSPEKNQCCGTTATSHRCTRLVVDPSSSPSRSRGTSPAPLGLDTLDEIVGNGGEREEVPRFCFQHAKQAMGERGCFVGSRGVWVEFDDWILPDLPTVTKILLRHEMARPPSDKDEEGYIYVHEMVEKRSSVVPSLHRTTFLKLGRSTKPVSRLAQWRFQCPSREPIVRDIFPRASNTSSAGAGLSGALRVAERGVRHHHRWERLMLIEVAGRAGMEAEERGKLVGSKGRGKRTCGDCGKVHLELFEVRGGAYEEWVREVVERWGRWCGDVLD